ncbi:10195_t:CDS:1, partial [Acaulospora colombiana]
DTKDTDNRGALRSSCVTNPIEMLLIGLCILPRNHPKSVATRIFTVALFYGERVLRLGPGEWEGQGGDNGSNGHQTIRQSISVVCFDLASQRDKT